MPPPDSRHLTAAAWLAALDLDAEACDHAADHLRVELLQLGDRWSHATPADLVCELRDEAARIAARGALTALRIDGNAALRADQRAQLDAALREAVVAVEAAYVALTAACARRPMIPPAATAEHPTPTGRASVKRERAAALLREQLADGPRPVGELVEAAVVAGISRSTLDVAASDLGVAREGRNQRTTWKLPRNDPAEHDPEPVEDAAAQEPEEETVKHDGRRRRRSPKRRQAVDLVRELLADGAPHRTSEILRAGERAGLSPSTIQAALQDRAHSPRFGFWQAAQDEHTPAELAIDVAERIVRAALTNGPRPAGDVIAAVIASGASSHTARRAAKRVGVRHAGRGITTVWRLPPQAGAGEREPVEAVAA